MVSPPFEEWFVPPASLPQDRDGAAYEAARRIEAAGIKVRMGKKGRVVVVQPIERRPPKGVVDRVKNLLREDIEIELRFKRRLFGGKLRARYERRPEDDGSSSAAGAAAGAILDVGASVGATLGDAVLGPGQRDAREDLKERAHKAWEH